MIPSDWTKHPRYLELIQQRDTLQKEIKSLQTQNEADRNRLNQEQNPIMKTRLEEKINRMNSKIQTKEEQLQEINLKIQRLQQTSI
jgi:TATA-binding protein-associated factor Taf7